MNNIKNKISKIEKVENEIRKLKRLKDECKREHIKPAIAFSNGGSLSGEVVIDNSLFEKLISEQIDIFELSISEDVKFMEAVELMISSKG